MTRAVAEAVKIPTTASGGAKPPRHPYEAVTIGKGSAIATASIFHFGEIPIPEAEKYLRKQRIPIDTETTWFVNKLGS